MGLLVIVSCAMGVLVVTVVKAGSLVAEIVTLGVVPVEDGNVTVLSKVVEVVFMFDVRSVAVVEFAEKEVFVEVVRIVVLTASAGVPDD